MSCVTGYTVKVLPDYSSRCGIIGVGASYLVRPVSTTTPSRLTMSLSVFIHLLFIVFSSQNTTEFTVYGTDGATLLDSCLYIVQVCTPFVARRINAVLINCRNQELFYLWETFQVRVEPYDSDGARPAQKYLYLNNCKLHNWI